MEQFFLYTLTNKNKSGGAIAPTAGASASGKEDRRVGVLGWDIKGTVVLSVSYGGEKRKNRVLKVKAPYGAILQARLQPKWLMGLKNPIATLKKSMRAFLGASSKIDGTPNNCVIFPFCLLRN